MSDTEEPKLVIEQIAIVDSLEPIIADGTPTKTLQKVKKPRSEAQIKAFEKAKIKRAENCELRKQEKLEKFKLSKKQKLESQIKEIDNSSDNSGEIIDTEDLDCDILGKETKPTQQAKQSVKQVKAKKPIKKTYVYESDSTDTEEEIIVVKKKPKKPKKPTKKKVVYESESESESSEAEEETVVYNTPNIRNKKLSYSDVFRFN